MTATSPHLEAKALFKMGSEYEAWIVARRDPGLLPHVTQAIWSDWMRALIARDE